MSTQVLPQQYEKNYGVAEAPLTAKLTGKSSLRQVTTGSKNSPHQKAAGCTAQQAAVADALTNTGALWYLALDNVTAQAGQGTSKADQTDAIHTIQLDSYQPFSLAACLPDIIQGVADSSPVTFPYLFFANRPDLINANMTYHGSPYEAILYPGLTRQQILDTPGSTSDYRLKWVELPNDLFNGSTIGAVVLLPRSEQEDSQRVYFCNVAAGWGTTTLTMHSNVGGTGIVSSQTSLNNKPISPNKIPLGKYASDPSGQELAHLFAFEYPNYPQRPINVTQKWAEYLNPSVPNLNTTAFSILMQQKFLPIPSAEIALATMMVNGLSRTSFTSVLQGSVKTVTGRDGSPNLDGNYWLSGKGDAFVVDPEESKDWVKFRVDSHLEGYAYNTINVSSRVAIAILMIYCVLAIAHVLYSGITGPYNPPPLKHPLSPSPSPFPAQNPFSFVYNKPVEPLPPPLSISV